jgi:hypothetical protein
MSTKDKLLFAIDKLAENHQTSMGVWSAYWRCRFLLRQLAMERYEKITESYIELGDDLEFPTEGFKEIANDTKPVMDEFNFGQFS